MARPVSGLLQRDWKLLTSKSPRCGLSTAPETGRLPHIRFHDLRYSAVTILLTMGVNAKVVQELLGHSHINMTLGTYSHVLPGMHKEAMEKMNELFRQPEGKGYEEVQ